MGTLANVIQRVSVVLPQVPKPVRKLDLKEKIIWSGIALAIYLAMGQIPLYGVPPGQQDPFAFARVIFASQQGTLLSLGIAPIIDAGLILQLLKGAEIIKLDLKKPEDRGLFTSATKVLTVVITVGMAFAFAVAGIFGPDPSPTTMFIIIAQLFVAGIVIMLLDEMIQKGWGIGSGISLFILAGIAQQVMWSLFSIIPVQDGPLGIIPFIVSSALSGNLGATILRPGGFPSVFALIVTIIIVLIIVYISGMRVEIPITSKKMRGFSGAYPLKLMYTSTVPIILVSALAANMNFLGQFIWSQFNPSNDSTFFNLIATYTREGNSVIPDGGLIYYITSPGGFEGAVQDPTRAVSYVLFMMGMAVIFSKLWVELGGLSAREAAKNLMGSNVQVTGFRSANVTIESLLNRYIPTLTIFSGLMIGLLAGVADITNAFGTGTGLLLLVDISLNLYQALMKERLDVMMPGLAGLLGK